MRTDVKDLPGFTLQAANHLFSKFSSEKLDQVQFCHTQSVTSWILRSGGRDPQYVVIIETFALGHIPCGTAWELQIAPWFVHFALYLPELTLHTPPLSHRPQWRNVESVQLKIQWPGASLLQSTFLSIHPGPSCCKGKISVERRKEDAQHHSINWRLCDLRKDKGDFAIFL